MFGLTLAYIDPGFAGMAVQIVLAVAVVGGTMVFAMRRKIKAMFTKKTDNGYENRPVVDHTVSEDGVVDTLAD